MTRKFVALRGSIAVLLLLLSAACTTVTVIPETATAPDKKYDMAAVGKITASDKLWEGLVPFFRRGFHDQLQQDPNFTSVLEDNPPDPIPPSMLVLTGTLTEVDKGSVAARFLIGLGAGREVAQGSFELKNSQGTVLARFGVRKTYNGGAGLGGADFVAIDDLVKKLGEDTANSVSHWNKGEKLNAPPKQ